MKLTINGRVIPKARPRFNKSGVARTSDTYRNWKNAAAREFSSQWFGRRTIKQAEIRIIFGGQQQGDLDNLAGAILDALTDGGILTDDRLKNVPELLLRWEPNEALGATITFSQIKYEDGVKGYKEDVKELEQFPC